MDKHSQILTIESGLDQEAIEDAGTLLRMYVNWIDLNEGTFEELDFDSGNGLNVALAVSGVDLSQETGIHSIDKISELDPLKRRHTTFTQVMVMDEPETKLQTKDFLISMPRYGAGGQTVSTTSSLVSVQHIPSGIVASARTGVSVHKNRAKAIRLLNALVWSQDVKLEMRRSYILDPYKRVIDSNGIETDEVHSVLYGDLTPFYLTSKSEKV